MLLSVPTLGMIGIYQFQSKVANAPFFSFSEIIQFCPHKLHYYYIFTSCMIYIIPFAHIIKMPLLFSNLVFKLVGCHFGTLNKFQLLCLTSYLHLLVGVTNYVFKENDQKAV